MNINNLKNTEKNQYYHEGVDAFLCGQSNNPYAKNSTSYNEWQEGYDYSELCQTSLCTKVTFENQGQGFVEWYINYANIIIDSQPMVERWIGSKVQTLLLSEGELLSIQTRFGKKVILDIPIIKVEPLTNDEYLKVGRSYKKWLKKIDYEMIKQKTEFSGKLIAETKSNRKTFSLYQLDNGIPRYIFIVKDQDDSLLRFIFCHTNEDITQLLGFTDPSLNLYRSSGLFSEQEIEELVLLYRDGN